jgi:hypothetical protein
VTIAFEVFGPGATPYQLSKVLTLEGKDISFTPRVWEPFNLEKRSA